MSPRILICLLVTTLSAYARVGETEQELVHRYGDVLSREPRTYKTQGHSYPAGEYLVFHTTEWEIQALIINGHCESISYDKKGDWTEAHFTQLLELNGGRTQWVDRRIPNPKLQKEWQRRDKAIAHWTLFQGFMVTTPVVESTRRAIDKTAKEETAKQPKP